MSSNPEWYDVTIEAAVSTMAALLNSGYLSIYTGGQPALDGALTGTLLVQLTFSATAFGSAVASAGQVTATANAISAGTAGNTGTAGYFAVLESDNATVVATGTAGTSGTDLIMDSASVVTGGVVSCSSFSISQAQSG